MLADCVRDVKSHRCGESVLTVIYRRTGPAFCEVEKKRPRLRARLWLPEPHCGMVSSGPHPTKLLMYLEKMLLVVILIYQVSRDELSVNGQMVSLI